MARTGERVPSFSSVLQGFEEAQCGSNHLMQTGLPKADAAFGSVRDDLVRRSAGHRHYRHYVTEDRAKRILRERSIYLTDGSTWNDRFDRQNFNPHFSGYRRFGACLSYSSSESIAMWMLYGGRDGNGAMLDFTAKVIASASQADEYEFGAFGQEGFVPMATVRGCDLRIELVDILYFRRSDADDYAYQLKRPSKGERWVGVSDRTFESLKPFSKHVSWSYENEVRWVATVDVDLLGRHPHEVTCMRVPLDLGNDFEEARVFSSPVATDSPFRDSELRGTVEWDLH